MKTIGGLYVVGSRTVTLPTFEVSEEPFKQLGEHEFGPIVRATMLALNDFCADTVHSSVRKVSDILENSEYLKKVRTLLREYVKTFGNVFLFKYAEKILRLLPSDAPTQIRKAARSTKTKTA